MIRNFLSGAVPKDQVKHCYIPQIGGKEKRKAKAGKEGLLGVEGVSDEVIIDAIRKSGATIIGGMPTYLSTNAMLTALNCLYSFEELKELVENLG